MVECIKNIIKKNKWIYDMCCNILQLKKVLFRSRQDRAILRMQKDGGEEIRYKYNLNKDSVVFDLGGYIGDWTEGINSRFHCKCYVFEPVQSFYNTIVKRFANNGNITVYPFGLDSFTHEGKILIENDGSSQYYTEEKLRKGGVQKIFYQSIGEFLEENDIHFVNLVKMNIEGGEYNILEFLLDTGLIKRFQHIQVQFHNIKEINGKKRMKQIQKKLKNTHELEWAYRPFVHESWKRKVNRQENRNE